MDKIIYKNKDVSKFFRQKENDIIELYARKKHKSFNEVKKIYNESKLKNVIDDLDNELWLESEYYILDSYENLMEKCPTTLAIVPSTIANAKEPATTKRPRRSQKKAGKGVPKNVPVFSMFDKLFPIYPTRTKENRAMLVGKGNYKFNKKNKSSRFKVRKRPK